MMCENKCGNKAAYVRLRCNACLDSFNDIGLCVLRVLGGYRGNWEDYWDELYRIDER